MKRILVVSDIHGELEKFIQLLWKAKFNSHKDQLILLGDYVDRGPNSKETVEYIIGLVKNHHAIALRGNHDEMFLDWLDNKDSQIDLDYLRNGGMTTLQSYFSEIKTLNEVREYIKKHYQYHIQFLRILPYYYETDKFVFVHAGINPLYEDWKLTPKEEMVWIRELFFL